MNKSKIRNTFIRFSVILLVLATVAPAFLSVASLAAESSAAADADIWDVKGPAYTSSTFFSVEERIAGNDVLSRMDLILVSCGYALYNDKLTGEVICLKLADPDENGEYAVDEKTGVYNYVGYYCTNPYSLGHSATDNGGAMKQDSSVSVKRTLMSQLLVKYKQNATSTTLESYVSSAMFDQINVKTIRGGLRVEYTIGREETTYLVPRQIQFGKWMDLLVQISEGASRKETRCFYAYYSLKAQSAEQLKGWGESYDKSGISTTTIDYIFMSREEFIKNNSQAPGIYGAVYDDFIYKLERLSDKTIKDDTKQFPCIEKFAIMVCDGSIKAAELRRVEQLIKLYTDYTKEQMEEDHAETEYVGSDDIPALFKMAIEYTIDELGLKIRMNAGNVRFDSSNYTLEYITVLPYAGACDVNNQGYIFSPDGSGTIFDLSKIVGKQFTTTNIIYGQDFAYHTITGANKETVRYPAFGAVETTKESTEYTEIEYEIDEETGEEVPVEVTKTIDTYKSYGYLAVITEGDSLAKLTVSNGGTLHMYASAYTTFNPRPSDTYALDGGISAGTDAMWTVESKRRYTGNYVIRVFILGGDTEASYSGMANVYRDYLTKTEVLTKTESENSDIPLYIKTLGALETSKTVLGVPVETTIALTSFDDTIRMLTNLKERGITNVKVVMEGWCNEGMWALVPTGVDICKVLGGTAGFKKLLEYANNPENGNIQLFPDFDFMYAVKDELFDGFDDDDLSKTIDDRGASLKEYTSVFQGYRRTGRGIISPNVIEKLYSKTYNEYKNFNVGGIAVTTMGSTLSSDFNEDDPLNREDSKKIVMRLLSTIASQNENVLVAGGNYYTWEYATDIIDVPLDDSRYSYTAASVPFYGMIVHGSKEFSGTAINLAGDYRYQLLKTIENGASPMFVIAVENTAELKNFSFDSMISSYYAVKYSIWLNTMVETYKELNTALKDVQNSLIVKHEFIGDSYKVVKVTYDNGTAFYINYLTKDYTVTNGDEKLVVPANSFVKVAE